MLSFFRLGYFFYRSIVSVMAPFNPKANDWVRGRREIYSDLKGLKPTDHTLWFHAASLGEFEMGRPIIEEMKRKYPTHKVVVSFFSPSGYNQRKNDPSIDFACYLPHDNPTAAKKFLDHVHPSLAVFIKYEFWPSILSECISRGIPTSVISATFRPDQFLFKPTGAPLRKLLQKFNLISVQDKRSEELLTQHGFHNVALTGDGRFDNVANLAEKQSSNAFLEKFLDFRPSLLAGSSWQEEEDILLPLIMKQTQLVFIFAPHDVNEKNIERLESRIPASSFRWSKRNEISNPEDFRVLIVDTIGELRGLYAQCNIAFVGGGYKTGLHNILEPASFGKPIFFGPKHQKFWEAASLVEAGGAKVITSSDQMNIFLEKYSSNRAEMEKMGEASLQFVEDHRGATAKIVEILQRQLS